MADCEKCKELENKIRLLEKELEYYKETMINLRTRCKESARDLFDNRMYGALTIDTRS